MGHDHYYGRQCSCLFKLRILEPLPQDTTAVPLTHKEEDQQTGRYLLLAHIGSIWLRGVTALGALRDVALKPYPLLLACRVSTIRGNPLPTRL